MKKNESGKPFDEDLARLRISVRKLREQNDLLGYVEVSKALARVLGDLADLPIAELEAGVRGMQEAIEPVSQLEGAVRVPWLEQFLPNQCPSPPLDPSGRWPGGLDQLSMDFTLTGRLYDVGPWPPVVPQPPGTGTAPAPTTGTGTGGSPGTAPGTGPTPTGVPRVRTGLGGLYLLMLYYANLLRLWQAWILGTVELVRTTILRNVQGLRARIGDQFVDAGETPEDIRRILECIDRCIEEFERDFDALIERTYRHATGTQFGDPLGIMRDFRNELTALIAALAQCMVDCLPGRYHYKIWAMLSYLSGRLLDRLLPVLAFGMVPLPGQLSRPRQEDPPRNRNGFRWLTKVGIVSCHHRKGGFGYEEFPDDSEENPDITDEDPNEVVDPIELSIICNPNKQLDGFTDAALELRRRAAKDWLDRLLRDIARLKADREAARQAGDTDAVGRLQAAIDTRVDEARCVRNVLYNTIVEMYERATEPRKQVLRQEAQAVRDRIISKD